MSYCCDVRAEMSIKDEVGVLKVCRKFDSSFPCTLHVEEGTLSFCDNYIKYHEDYWDDFAEAIAPYVDDEIIEFTGEDGKMWGIYFKDGAWYQYEPVVITPKGMGVENFRQFKICL